MGRVRRVGKFAVSARRHQRIPSLVFWNSWPITACGAIYRSCIVWTARSPWCKCPFIQSSPQTNRLRPLQTLVASAAHVYHHDPNVFSDPGSFRPERWLVGDVEISEMEKNMMPFSKGSRQCPGQKYVSLFPVCKAYIEVSPLHDYTSHSLLASNFWRV